MLKKIISYLSIFYLFPHVFFYLIFKKHIIGDIERCKEHHEGLQFNGLTGLLFLLCFDIAFRGLFYYRIGKFSVLISFLLPSFKSLMINSNVSIGKRALLVHAYSTIINPTSIGDNFRITHCCTIGNSKNGKPIIKDNVTMNAGSIVFGPIIIGNNVIIGAGAVVSKSIPDNCTVIGNPAYIIKREGLRVNEKL